MIYQTGNARVYSAQLAEAKEKADESFCRQSSEGFMVNVPSIPGYVPAMKDATLLKLRSVEPHDDPWVGYEPTSIKYPPGWTMNGPKERRAIFWLLHAPSPIFLQCGRQAARLQRGDFVVFDDSILHCVVAEKKWIGAAWQIMEERFKQC